MNVIYNRIGEEFITVEEARDILFEIDRSTKEVDWADYSQLDLDDCCERLNSENVYDCGTCYYIVDENITKADLNKVIYG